MSLKTVYVNSGCNAKCYHCPYGSAPSLLTENASNEISNSSEGIILFSGGEPLELKFNEIKDLINDCLKNYKIFRIATGGHIPLNYIARNLASIPLFSGFSIGTDVIIKSRNNNFAKYSLIWSENINILDDLNINYSITISLSKDIGEDFFLSYISIGSPDFIMINSIDSIGTGRAKDCKLRLENMGYMVVYGYLA
ncbi:hypothetical protein R7035_12185 [Vibrio sp. 1731]|uniref:hypothetical protein n=1 Tax=Vibrio sp. 1731 TaxID=3074573 RepID=UPI0021D3C153|nr:hypothetical protein [Vibrio sp. 1731]MDW2114272.1 hypothetical protein [Vibrio sp. 1731]